MDGIQAYKGDAVPPSPSRPSTALAPAATNPAAVKTTSNYLRALVRRFWVVLAVAVPLAVTTSILVLRQPPVYSAKVEIEIKPPELDQWLTTLVATESGRRDASGQANYVANHEVKLRGRLLADRVVSDPAIAPKVSHYADAGFRAHLEHALVQQVKHTNTFLVSLEGTDPALTKELLETLLREFKVQTTEENFRTLEATKQYAEENLKNLKAALKDLDERIMTSIAKSPHARTGRPEHSRGTICQSRHTGGTKTTSPGRDSPADVGRSIFPQVRARS